MKRLFIPENTRGKTHYRWLNASHFFSFADYRSVDRMGFGKLRVFNDDIFGAGGGFDTHSHDNMEIITIVLEGELRHKDSMGHQSILYPGDVQTMSAGSGIEHSEFNNSNDSDLKLFQIWIKPKLMDIVPTYQQRNFSQELSSESFVTLVSPDGRDHSLPINQDAYISRFHLKADENYCMKSDSLTHGLFFVSIKGRGTINDQELDTRDGFGIDGERDIYIKSRTELDLLVISVPW